MNYLSVENLTKSFGDRMLFSDITFGIDQGQKVAIVAKNGSGKTTLLRCLMDKEQFDSGRIVYRNDIRVAFMEQSENMDDEMTIMEAVFDHDLPEIQAVKKYNLAMKNQDDEMLNECFQELTDLNAWDIEVKVAQILSVLKLDNTDVKVGSLSGSLLDCAGPGFSSLTCAHLALALAMNHCLPFLPGSGWRFWRRMLRGKPSRVRVGTQLASTPPAWNSSGTRRSSGVNISINMYPSRRWI